MNWDALGAVAEILGAIGVIVTLVYLAVQIRQNTLMMRATVKQNQTTITHSLTSLILENVDLIMKANSGSELSEKEEFEYMIIARGVLRGWETYCYMRDIGLRDDTEWYGIKLSIERFASQP